MANSCVVRTRCAFFAEIGQIFGLHFLFVRASPHIKLQQRTHKTLIFLIKMFAPKRTSWPFQHQIHTHTSALARSIIVRFYFTIFACVFLVGFFWAVLSPFQCFYNVFNKGMPCSMCLILICFVAVVLCNACVHRNRKFLLFVCVCVCVMKSFSASNQNKNHIRE